MFIMKCQAGNNSDGQDTGETALLQTQNPTVLAPSSSAAATTSRSTHLLECTRLEEHGWSQPRVLVQLASAFHFPVVSMVWFSLQVPKGQQNLLLCLRRGSAPRDCSGSCPLQPDPKAGQKAALEIPWAIARGRFQPHPDCKGGAKSKAGQNGTFRQLTAASFQRLGALQTTKAHQDRLLYCPSKTESTANTAKRRESPSGMTQLWKSGLTMWSVSLALTPIQLCFDGRLDFGCPASEH